MSEARIPHDQVHHDLDAHYFADYAIFTGAVRTYVARTLEQAFRADPNDAHRRLCAVGLYKEEFAAYEDLGAFLEAMLRWRRGELKVPFEGILRYKDDKVALGTLFARRSISSPTELFDALGLSEWIPTDWSSQFPTVNCRAALVGICTFIVIDCTNNQQHYGIDAYNRIKHGLALFPSGRKYAPDLPDCPAVIITCREKNSPNPYALYAMPMTDTAIEQRGTTVEFVQASLRALAALYVIAKYPTYFAERASGNTDTGVFRTNRMIDVMQFFSQIARKYAPDGF
jgi:hypothetical protein